MIIACSPDDPKPVNTQSAQLHADLRQWARQVVRDWAKRSGKLT
jgi:hypothetical protein